MNKSAQTIILDASSFINLYQDENKKSEFLEKIKSENTLVYIANALFYEVLTKCTNLDYFKKKIPLLEDIERVGKLKILDSIKATLEEEIRTCGILKNPIFLSPENQTELINQYANQTQETIHHLVEHREDLKKADKEDTVNRENLPKRIRENNHESIFLEGSNHFFEKLEKINSIEEKPIIPNMLSFILEKGPVGRKFSEKEVIDIFNAKGRYKLLRTLTFFDLYGHISQTHIASGGNNEKLIHGFKTTNDTIDNSYIWFSVYTDCIITEDNKLKEKFKKIKKLNIFYDILGTVNICSLDEYLK